MRYILFLLMIGIASCKQAPQHVDFSADIANIEAKEITVSGFDFKQEIPVEDGKVMGTLDITEEGIYTVGFGRNRANVYLAKGDKISLSADAEKFGETMKIESPHTAIQSFLKEKNAAKRRIFSRDMYNLKPEEYLTKIKNGTDSMNMMIADAGLPAAFAAQEKENTKYSALRYQFIYPEYSRQSLADLPADFQNVLDGMDMTDEKKYLSSSDYKNLVNDHFAMNMYRDTSGSYEEVFMKRIKTLATGNIKNQLLYGDMRYMMGPNEKMDAMFSFFKENSTNEEHIAKMQESYDGLLKLVKGNPSPDFKYENYKGGETELNDLKGKYVYVDVWATWCGPCIGEIPSLKKVEKQFHDKNIEFVSISIDNKEDYDKWRNMIENRELGGEQLMADNAWESKFVQDYKINGIPRFILIDPQGNIVSADAPRPSDDKLVETFNGLEL